MTLASTPAPPPSGDVQHKHATLDKLLKKIQRRSHKVKALEKACKDLVSHCEQVCNIAQQAPPSSEDDQRVFNVLKEVIIYLERLSYAIYIWHKGPEYLQNKMRALRIDLSAAASAQQLPLVSQTAALEGSQQTSNEGTQQMTREEENRLGKDIVALRKALEKAKSPRSKAFTVYQMGSRCIPSNIPKWMATDSLVPDGDSEKQVRFGTLFSASMGDKMVLVKRVGEIHGTSKPDTTKRSKALASWLDDCEALMPVEFIQLPDLIVYGAISATPLDLYLSENTPSTEEQLLLATRMAGALAYVHKCNIIHRDVRAASIFMVENPDSGELEPKLSGFEICRFDDKCTYSLGDGVLEVWDGPERRQKHGTSFQSDVFAFGVLMHEIALGHPPQWEPRPETESVVDQVKFNVTKWLTRAYHCAPSVEYWSLMESCLNTDFVKRPTMQHIFTELSKCH